MSAELHYLLQVLPAILLYSLACFAAGTLCAWLLWHERGKTSRKLEAENRRLRHELRDLQQEAS